MTKEEDEAEELRTHVAKKARQKAEKTIRESLGPSFVPVTPEVADDLASMQAERWAY